MSILSTIRRFASDWQASRSQWQTRRLLAGLPAEIQKDIGWPVGQGSSTAIGRGTAGRMRAL